ncbi:Hsp20/alpha crystallin family protein [Pendulispora albinea]|uniref:Hsp20/alpha crystallin family protein n=1 Tax=Pendulispora albinea TaxID=2741071 RepID=A0ABZ2LQ15_9BACT
MTEIDETIGKVENLYRSLTGQEAPELKAPFAPIPAERDPVEHVQEQIERLNQILGVATGQPTAQPQAWTPLVSLWESPEELLLSVDLPGVNRQGLEVSIQGTPQGNVIIVTGRRGPPQAGGATTNGNKLVLLRAEHPIGILRRVIPLPLNVKTDQIASTFQDGVLTIRAPRQQQTTPINARNIPIT